MSKQNIKPEEQSDKVVDVDGFVRCLDQYIEEEMVYYEQQVKNEKFSGNIAKENFWRGSGTAIKKLKMFLSRQDI